MNKEEFKSIIKRADYKTKYEPIIDIKNDNKIFAYEALSKFAIDEKIISTEEIFRKLHYYNNLFFELEKRNKLHQVNKFDKKEKLFLNFDADIVKTEEQKNYWEKFLKQYKDNIVVEITENGSDDEVSSSIMRSFAMWLKEKGIDSALDDFAQDGSMFSFFIMNRCKYIKIDKSFLKQIKTNKNYISYLCGLLETIRKNGQKSIIEGVETKEDLDLIQNKLDCDFVQGYYFSNLTLIR
ncbi:EAL domain-containing protein [Campylobacterota bacterium DY0563]